MIFESAFGYNDVKEMEIISSTKRGKDLLVKITFDNGDIFEGWVEKQ